MRSSLCLDATLQAVLLVDDNGHECGWATQPDATSVSARPLRVQPFVATRYKPGHDTIAFVQVIALVAQVLGTMNDHSGLYTPEWPQVRVMRVRVHR